VFAAPSIRLEAVGEIAKGSNRHMSPYNVQLLWLPRAGSDYFF